MNNPHKTLHSLGLSPSEIKVYLTMLTGIVRVKDITKTTQLVRPTVYYAISGLEQMGLITRMTIDGENTWQPASPKKLSRIVQKRQKNLSDLSEDVEKLIVNLSKELPTKYSPRVTYYEGIEAVANVAMESLYCISKEILSIAPEKNFFHDTSQEVIQEFINERARRKISTKHLWEKPVSKRTIATYYSERAIKILPPVMHGQFHSVIFIYDDKTLYISSRDNAYGVLIESQEHTQMMRAIFNGLWTSSTPHPQ